MSNLYKRHLDTTCLGWTIRHVAVSDAGIGRHLGRRAGNREASGGDLAQIILRRRSNYSIVEAPACLGRCQTALGPDAVVAATRSPVALPMTRDDLGADRIGAEQTDRPVLLGRASRQDLPWPDRG
jgi:hypothetical protein